jgi:hypothetical protein
MVCPPATSEAGARPLEGQLSLQINECLEAISFEKAFNRALTTILGRRSVIKAT